MVQFDATVLVCTKQDDGSWKEEVKNVTSADDMKKVFTPYEDDLGEAHVNGNMFVYYQPRLIKSGIDAVVKDDEGETHYMNSPILVACCTNVPQKLTKEFIESVKDYIKFY